MVDSNSIAEVFANEQEMYRLVQAIHNINESVSGLADKLGVIVDRTESISNAVRNTSSDVNRSLEDTTVQVDSLLEKSEEAFKTIDRFGQKLKGVFSNLGIDNVAKAIGNISHAALGLQTNPQGMIRGMLGRMGPMGSFLQLLMNSEIREDAFRTGGRQSMLAFRGSDASLTSGGVMGRGAGIGEEMRRLEEAHLAAKEEVKAVYDTIAQGGFTAAQAIERVGEKVAGFGDTAAGAALGLDKAFGVAAGTSAQFAVQLSQDTGASLKDSIDLVQQLGLASHKTGMTMQTFIGTVTQLTGSLRLQGGSAEDLAASFLNIESAFKKALPSEASDLHVATITGVAMQGMGGFIQGMPEGLKGILGQRIAASLGVDFGPNVGRNDQVLKAISAMSTGFQMEGVGKVDFERRVVEEAFRFFQEKGLSPAETERLVTQSGGNAMFARAMREIQEKGKGIDSVFAQGKLDEATKDVAKKLDEAQKLQPLSIGAFDTMMRDLQNLMRAIGQSIISILGALLNTTMGGFETLFRIMTDVGNRDIYAEAYQASVSRNFTRVGANLQSASRIADSLGGGIGNMISGLLGRPDDAAAGSMVLTKSHMEQLGKLQSSSLPIIAQEEVQRNTRNFLNSPAMKRLTGPRPAGQPAAGAGRVAQTQPNGVVDFSDDDDNFVIYVARKRSRRVPRSVMPGLGN